MDWILFLISFFAIIFIISIINDETFKNYMKELLNGKRKERQKKISALSYNLILEILQHNNYANKLFGGNNFSYNQKIFIFLFLMGCFNATTKYFDLIYNDGVQSSENEYFDNLRVFFKDILKWSSVDIFKIIIEVRKLISSKSFFVDNISGIGETITLNMLSLNQDINTVFDYKVYSKEETYKELDNFFDMLKDI